MLPLHNPSDLQNSSFAMCLHSMSEGYIGELSLLLNKAAVHAVKSKAEVIDKKVLDAIDWVSPSERKKQMTSIR